MHTHAAPRGSTLADMLFTLLNPIPFGSFVAALIFDIVYAQSAEIMWTKGAAWLLVIGLFAAILPRFINLGQVWISGRRTATSSDRLDFWLNAAAIVAAIFNAFVHGRDAYAVVPTAQWLSLLTVVLIALGHVVTVNAAHRQGRLS